MVRWNRYTSDGVRVCWLVLITHPTSRFPGIASKKMPMRIKHRVIAAVGSRGLCPHFKVSGSAVNVLDSLILESLILESFQEK